MDPLLQALMKETGRYLPEKEHDLIVQAFEFAKAAHKGQLRENGDPYISHAVATAEKLVQWQLPSILVATGLLHDVIEDTGYTLDDLQKEFGEEIANLVESESKLSKLSYQGKERYAENLRKLFLAMAKDVRVLFIKFADRAHNLETLEHMNPDKRHRKALETIQIFAPIAGRLGMGEIKAILEDLSFPHVYPDEHKWLKNLIKGKYEAKEKALIEVQKIVKKELERTKIPVKYIYGRTKHIYSLYRKLLKYNKDLSQIYDLVAIRLIVPTVADCYAALGIIHSRFKPLKGRIKDYIATPKPNGYQSLHTTVFSDMGEIVEFQIRTPAMHEGAEYGIAAHWRYDESGKQAKNARQVRWMEELSKIQKELEDRRTFLETLEELKIDIFQNRIFVFTPKGDVIDLPDDSTPIDFAYAIHTDIGNQCSRARVNGELVPLGQKLSSGDILEIVVDKKRKGPNADWLKFVKTRNAKNKIKAHARHTMKEWIAAMLPHGGKKKI